MIGGPSSPVIHAVVSVSWRADQIVSGTAVWFLGLGLTGYLYIDIYGAEGTPGDVPGTRGSGDCWFSPAATAGGSR